MRTLMIMVGLVTAVATATAQPAGSGSATGSAAGSATAPTAGAGSAAGSAADPAPAPPAGNTSALRQSCEAAVTAKKDDKLFIDDVSNIAAAALSRVELVKTPEGKACLDALEADAELRTSLSTAAEQRDALARDALVLKQHDDAAKAISKNQKHVVLAYAAMWLLSIGFILFLWRRQQGLRTEIAHLKRDLDAAAK